ncbi:MAG TPA: iron ABC transporter permease [Deinococcales bacterium]|nr:iron ABC transporter permease [Deinococcales bacterium]
MASPRGGAGEVVNPARPAARRLPLDTRLVAVALIALAVAFISLFPLAVLVWRSLVGLSGSLSLEHYAETLGNESNRAALVNTLVVASGTTLLSFVIGVPLAVLLTRTNVRNARTLVTLYSIPYLVPPVIGGIAWLALLGPRVGVLNQLFTLAGLGEIKIYGLLGLIWVEALFHYVYVFLGTRGALQAMDASLEEAARVSGAGPWRVFREITLPAVRPALVSSGILVFLSSSASFGIPVLIGSPGGVNVLSTRIVSLVNFGTTGGLRGAAALSVTLMLLSVLLLWLQRRMLRGSFVVVTGKATRPGVVSLGRATGLVTGLLWAVWAGLILLPFLGVIFNSFVPLGAGLDVTRVSLAAYQYVFELSTFQEGLRNSVILAVSASAIITLLGTAIAYMRVRFAVRGREIPDFLAGIPYAVPGTVLALAMILALSGQFGISLLNTLPLLLVAYTAKYLSFSTRTVGAALAQVDQSLEEAARVSGATWERTFVQIVWPLLVPSLIASFFLTFMPTLTELTMSVLLQGPGTRTIGTVLFELQAYSNQSAAAALAVMLMLAVLAVNQVIKLATRGRYGF